MDETVRGIQQEARTGDRKAGRLIMMELEHELRASDGIEFDRIGGKAWINRVARTGAEIRYNGPIR